MEQLVQPNRLRERMPLWVEEEVRTDGLPSQSGNVLEAVLYRGELPHGDSREVRRQGNSFDTASM